MAAAVGSAKRMAYCISNYSILAISHGIKATAVTSLLRRRQHDSVESKRKITTAKVVYRFHGSDMEMFLEKGVKTIGVKCDNF